VRDLTLLITGLNYLFFILPGVYLAVAWSRWKRDPEREAIAIPRRLMSVGALTILTITWGMLMTLPDAIRYAAPTLARLFGWPPSYAYLGSQRYTALSGILGAFIGSVVSAFMPKATRLLTITSGILQVYLYMFSLTVVL
jgi:hypothetical protein